MGNYKKGIWDEVSDTALDTEAAHSVSDESLDRFIGVDHNMDNLQEIAYSHLESIVKWSTDEWARAHAARALQYLSQAEALESQNEDNVTCGQVHLKQARDHNHRVIGIAEYQRVEVRKC